MQIVPLSLDHEAALSALLADFASVGETDVPGWFADPAWPWAKVVGDVNAWGRGERLPNGWSTCTTRFLEEDGELLGLFNLRHELSEGLRRYGGHMGYAVRPSARRQGHATRLCRAGMSLGAELGIERFLLTCEPTNVGSVVVIERCGGVLEDEYFHEGLGRLVRRYWIDYSA